MASIAAGNRPSGTAVIVVATGERSASAWIAPARPVSVSTAGWIPRASSRSSVSASRASLPADSISDPSSGSAAAAPVAGHPQGQAQGHQPLLCAVVQVAFQPAPLGVPGLDDPCPGRTDLLELGLHLGLQPGVLQGHARRRRRQLDQLRLERQSLVVDQDGLVRARHSAPRPARDRAGPRRRPGSRCLDSRTHPVCRNASCSVESPSARASASRSRPGEAPGSRSTIAVPSAPPAVRARTVLITNRAGPASITSGASPKLTRLERGRLRALPVTICSIPTAQAEPHQRDHGPPGPAARRPPVPDDQGQHDAR